MGKILSGINAGVGTAIAGASAYFTYLTYLDTHPARASGGGVNWLLIGGAILGLVGLALLVVGVIGLLQNRKPSLLKAIQEGKERARRAVPAQAATPLGTPQPDWPIRNLFFHLKPSLRETKNQSDFEEVAGEIIDKLSTGQLLAWGRANDRSRTLPLKGIPEDYWLHAKLVVWLLDDDGGNVLQAEPADLNAPNKTQYREILINQAQARAEWPSLTPVKRHGYDTPLSRAHAYLADLWGVEHGSMKVWDALRSAARTGEITIWGRPGGNGLNPDHFYKPPEPIDAIHWREFGFDNLRCLYSEDPRQCRTQPDGGRDSLRWDETYADLRINMPEIEARWP